MKSIVYLAGFIVLSFVSADVSASDVSVTVGNSRALDGTRSMCDMYNSSDGLSCNNSMAPVHASIIGERAECLNTAPHSYPSQDEVIIFLDTPGNQRSFKYRYHGFRQNCKQAVNIEISVDGTWHNLGSIEPTPQGSHEVLSISCEGQGCGRPKMSIDGFRVCNRYSGSDCN